MKSIRGCLVRVAILSLFAPAIFACSDEPDNHRDAADVDIADAGDVGDTASNDIGESRDTVSDDTISNDVGDTASTDTRDATNSDTEDAVANDTVNSDASQGLPTTCEGVCREHDLSVNFGAETGEFDRAFYGLTGPQVASSGQWEVHIEAHEGGAAGCPQEDSPSPDATLIVTGLVLPLDAAPRTKADGGVIVTFLDFGGRYLGALPFASATEATATPKAANVDTALVAEGVRDQDGLVALDLQATFESGVASGHLVATHCPSMDAVAP